MALDTYIKTCGKNIPGNRYIFAIAEIKKITSVTETSKEISAVTMAGGTGQFKAVTAELDTVQYTSEGTFTTAGAETQNLIAKFGNRSTELETLLDNLRAGIACGYACIWVDNNGRAWLAGVSTAIKEGKNRPFNTMTTSHDSGLLPTDTDAAAYTMTLTRLSGYAPVEFDATQTALILKQSASAAYIKWS